MVQLIALQTFLICFNGQLYSTESDVVYSNNTKIGLVEIRDAVDLESIQSLHEQCKKLPSDELILLLAMLASQKPKPDEKLFKIMKTYLLRALVKEGII